ncbi:MAG: glycosyltransferase, partial [Pseudomonadota bacterium]|nr:glycosyltransferase [Pseudomonadota bacterium]
MSEHSNPPTAQQQLTQQNYQVAEDYFKKNNLPQAEALCRQILVIEPQHADTLHLLGLIGAQTGHLQEAEGLIYQAVTLKPNDNNYRENLAKVQQLKQEKSRNYPNWVRKYATLTEDTLKQLQEKLAQWQNLPLISVIMPTYNSDERWLRIAIESVVQQIYPHWELCIADDASTLPHVQQILSEYRQKDERIKVHFRASNGHISAASNSALALAQGDYVAFLDHDDLLARHALFMIAAEVMVHPSAALIYSDEDKVNSKHKRASPYFKCDWNPDLFLAQNFMTHLSAYKTTLVRQIGGLRVGYEGAQDYDLALRVIEQIQASQIRHIPHVLYHWRLHEDSSSLIEGVKPYALQATQKAVKEYLQRQGQDAQVFEAFNAPGYIRVHYPLPLKRPLVSIIIPTYNQVKLLRNCVDSLLGKTRYQPFEIIIVDNQSDDPKTLDYLYKLQQQEPQVRVLSYPHPFNYSAINNMAVEQAAGELICLLNNDTEVIHEEWLTELASQAMRPEIGAVGARLWYDNNTLQHGGVIVGLGGVAGHSHKHFPRQHPGYFYRTQLMQNFSAVTAACMMMRKQVFQAVGGLNSTELSIAFNDVDLCLKIGQLGLRILWTPYAELYHYESKSRGRDTTPEKQARFAAEKAYMQKRWQKLLPTDPAYNPNLTLVTENFDLAWPPRVLLNESIQTYIGAIDHRLSSAAPLGHRIPGYALLKGHGLVLGSTPLSLPHACLMDYYDITHADLNTVGLQTLPNHQFDFIIAANIFEEVMNPIWIVQELFRVVKPSGHIVIQLADKAYGAEPESPSFEQLLEYYQSTSDQPTEDKRYSWDSEGFKDFLLRSFNWLHIPAYCAFESVGAENRCEYFSIWKFEKRPHTALVYLDAMTLEADNPELYGFAIDYPTAYTRLEHYFLEVRGWVVGRQAAADAIELIDETSEAQTPIAKTTFTVARPDVTEQFPQLSQSDKIGFSVRVNILELAPEVLLTLVVVLENQSRIRLANLRVQRFVTQLPKPHKTAQTKLAFMHIPKTAGTAFRRLVEQAYPGDDCLLLYEDILCLCYENEPYTIKALQGSLLTTQVLYGHFPFGIHAHLGIGCRYVTLLRHPIELIISYYNDLAVTPDRYLHTDV